MYEVKVTPDNGARYTVTVAGSDLQATIKAITKQVVFGDVVSFTVHPIWESVGA